MGYTLPTELEPYRHLIGNTGGNSVEELIDRLDEEGIAFSNSIVFTMAISVDEQVKLLRRLYHHGLLIKDAEK